jgi:hypothetical protein
MTGPPTRSQITQLDAKLDLTVSEIEELKPLVRRSNSRSKVGLFVGLIGVIVGAIGLLTAFYAREASKEIRSTRTESRIAACQQDNVLIASTRGAITDSILALAANPNELTSVEQLLYDAYAARVANGLPFWDCSPAGIVAYYENPPVDPGATP